MSKILFIDSSNNQQIKVGLILNDKEYTINHKIDKQKAQIILPLIEEILKNHNINLKDITHIRVNPGPGSFTGIRVGLTIANTLGFTLKIPINDKPVGTMAEPIYI